MALHQRNGPSARATEAFLGYAEGGTVHKRANTGICFRPTCWSFWPRRPADRRNADSKPSLDLHGRVFFTGPCGYFASTVTIQRLSEPSPCSFTERTIPVTVDPISVNVASRPRYWAKRARLASVGSVVSMVCIIVPVVAVRETIPRPVQKLSAKH
jgi:hypothetical protein